MSANDAAIALARSRRTIWRMIQRGELKPVRIGAHQAIPIAQINALVGAA